MLTDVEQRRPRCLPSAPLTTYEADHGGRSGASNRVNQANKIPRIKSFCRADLSAGAPPPNLGGESASSHRPVGHGTSTGGLTHCGSSRCLPGAPAPGNRSAHAATFTRLLVEWLALVCPPCARGRLGWTGAGEAHDHAGRSPHRYRASIGMHSAPFQTPPENSCALRWTFCFVRQRRCFGRDCWLW